MEGNIDAWRIVRALHRAAQVQRRAAAADPFGPVSIGLLNLAAAAPIRPGAAAAALDVPAQSITRAVTDLTAAGLVHRQGDTADGRSYAIALTAEGQEELGRFRADLAERFAAHLADWTPEEIATFAERLDTLVERLAGDVPESAPPAAGRNPWRSA
jgi:DNA-binding MarR family transcriptional regulator